MSLRAVIAVVPVLLMIAACDRQATTPSQPNASATAPSSDDVATAAFDVSKKGKPAPADAFIGPDGKPVTLAAFKGRPVLVNLWATWCGPCVKEMPALDRIAARGAGKLAVIAVNQGEDAAATTKWWAARNLPALASYRDEESKLGFAFESGMLPTTILYDADGKEVWRLVGSTDWDGAKAQAQVATVIG